MNVRIEDQALRFKMTEQELGQLSHAHCLHVKVNFFGKEFVVSVSPKGHDKNMALKLVQDQDEVYLQLLIPPEIVQKLSDMGRSRAGVQQEVDGVSVSLQVDVREDSRKVVKR